MSWSWLAINLDDLDFERDDLTDYAAAVNDRPAAVPTRRENTVGVLLLVAAALVVVAVTLVFIGGKQ